MRPAQEQSNVAEEKAIAAARAKRKNEQVENKEAYERALIELREVAGRAPHPAPRALGAFVSLFVLWCEKVYSHKQHIFGLKVVNEEEGPDIREAMMEERRVWSPLLFSYSSSASPSF